MIALKRILVATDFEEASTAAVIYARALARSFDAELHLLHVMENLFLRAVVVDPASLKAAVQNRLLEQVPPPDRERLRVCAAVDTSDEPAETIVRYAKSKEVDLIVMGTHGRKGAAHVLMGSVAERVVRTAPCPVLTVRHPEREFVVADEGPAAVCA